jgi:serine/threonine protein kinase
MLSDRSTARACSASTEPAPLVPYLHFICRLSDITRDEPRLEQAIRDFGAISDRAEPEQRGNAIPRIVSGLAGSALLLGNKNYILHEFIGSGASGFVFAASENQCDAKVALKFFAPVESAGASTPNDGDVPLRGSFQAEVQALRRVKLKTIPNVQQLECSVEVLFREANQSTGIIVSELVPGRPYAQIQDKVGKGELPAHLMAEAYLRMAKIALDLADCGLSIDDLSPSHFFAVVDPQGEIEQLRLIDLGSSSFYGPEDHEFALKENLTALSYHLRDVGIVSSPRGEVRTLAGDIEAGLEDLANGTITIEEFGEYLRRPQR